LAQWPLAEVASKFTTMRRPTRMDALIAFIVIFALLCVRQARGKSLFHSGVLLIAACFLLSVGQFLAFRESLLVISLGLCALVWLLGAYCSFAVHHKQICLMSTAISGVFGVAVLGELALVAKSELFPMSLPARLVGRIKEQDDKLTFRPLPNTEAHSNGPDFDVVYHMDADAGRFVPGRRTAGPKWLCFGCSYTFGEGLNDSDTIPAKIQAKNPNCCVYNYALGAYGTTDNLIQMTNRLKEHSDSSICIYFLIPDHLRRNVCPPEVLATSWGSKPRYILDLNDSLHFVGKTDRTMSIGDKVAVSLIRRSGIASSLYPEWQPDYDAVHLTAKLISEMNMECQHHKPARFLAVLLPQTTIRWPSSLAALEQEMQTKVTILNLERKFSEYLKNQRRERAEYFFPHDSHPNSNYTSLIASWVSEFILANNSDNKFSSR
jgi:hypothetical protein